MKILIYSPLFYPSIGGLETVVLILAQEFVAQGHQVKLVSQTPSAELDKFPFEVIRNPHAYSLLALTRWCDIYFQPNISLKGIWPLFLIHKPWVVAHHNWYTRTNGELGWQDYIKHFMVQFASGISVSQAVANHISTPSKVIPNPYREDVFYQRSNIPRDQELIFVGRLVSDKGVDLLLEALSELKETGLTPKLTVVGAGVEGTNLHELAESLNIQEQVNFVGIKVEQELAELLNRHQIMVVPSRWQEPFGVVALEGIACGCVVIGSEGGGLKEAIGLCGVTFPNGQVTALTTILANLLTDPEQMIVYRKQAEKHLSIHQKSCVAQAYLQVFEEALH